MTISTQCLECKHYTGLSNCEAFPDKISQEIFDGTFDHTNEYPGDNGIIFEKESIISKGEKIVAVKATSKRKAHKRKIKITRDLERIGNGERYHNGTSTNYKESVKNVNDYISKLHESDEGKKILEAIQGYTLTDYSGINNYMKNPMNFSDLPKDVLETLQNKVSNVKKFINDAPKFNGKVYRGLQYRINNPESEMRWNNFIKKIEGSKEMKFGSFLSTSQDRGIAIQFATRHSHKSMKQCIIIIKTKSGIPIEKLSQVESEREVLLDNDKTYKIIKFEKQDDKNHFLHLEEI